ncbi:PREDICTED: putative late blight resistance protein homolog R1B-12 [Nicotiana attenuata]|nr:PREDICTED: putative late blight resistance protein homolog R1B-12 [Nicotiana attenuata]
MFFWGKLLMHAPPHRKMSLFTSFKLIRVLAIFSHLFSSFPVEITRLIHLRYLWIRSNGNLPASVSQLYHLQTLVLQQPELFYMYKTLILPREIWNMTQLRRLRLLSGNYLSKPKRTDEGATDNVLGLRNLEELSHLCLASCTEEVFSCIPNIRKLSILDAASDDASEYLKNLVHLEKLETLKCVCYGQKRLSLSNWCASLTSVKRLILSGCLLLSEDMANLATLPNLEVLKLRDNEFEGHAWRLSDEDEFNQLKFLLLAEPRLVKWELASSVNFPTLQKLVLRKCICLEEIPIDIGEICTLEAIELICCSPAQNSATEIQEEQESMGNSCLDVRVYADDESSSLFDFWRAVLD